MPHVESWKFVSSESMLNSMVDIVVEAVNDLMHQVRNAAPDAGADVNISARYTDDFEGLGAGWLITVRKDL